MKKFFITTILILTTIASVFAEDKYPETVELVKHSEKTKWALSDDPDFMQQFLEAKALENVDELVLALQEVPGNEDCVFYYTFGVKVALYDYGTKLPKWFSFNGDKSKMNFVLEELNTRKGGMFTRVTRNKKSISCYILQMYPTSKDSTHDCMFSVVCTEIEAFTPEELKEERWQKYIEEREFTLYTK